MYQIHRSVGDLSHSNLTQFHNPGCYNIAMVVMPLRIQLHAAHLCENPSVNTLASQVFAYHIQWFIQICKAEFILSSPCFKSPLKSEKYEFEMHGASKMIQEAKGACWRTEFDSWDSCKSGRVGFTELSSDFHMCTCACPSTMHMQ